MSDPCACGSTQPYAVCCGRFLERGELPLRAEELMRSRYTAFVRGDAGYLVRTWHPRTRPDSLDLPDPAGWRGLRVLDLVDGEPGDEAGVVEFEATYDGPDGRSVQRERSRFARRAGRWLYLDGELA